MDPMTSAVFHSDTCTFPSHDPETSSDGTAGLKATDHTQWLWPVMVERRSPVRTSQVAAVWSMEPEARIEGSVGWKAREVIQEVWPWGLGFERRRRGN